MLGNLLRRAVERWRIQRDPVAYARSLGVRVGEGCRLLGVTHGTFGSEPYLVKLGNHVSITQASFVTHDGGVWVFRAEHPKIDRFGPIVVGDNVFMGVDVLVLPGVVIGDNCIIGARSVVTKSIPPGSVAAGVPARVICTVEDYWSRIKDKCLETKTLSGTQKREFVEQHFAGAFDADTSVPQSALT